MVFAIKSTPWLESIRKIIEENKTIQDEDSFIYETVLLVFGIVSSEKYIGNLETEAHLSHEDAEKISLEVGERILNPILELINKNKTETKIDPVTSKKRVGDIVNKYGLSTSQATVLENEVMSVIDRNLGEKITGTDLVNLLNISNILADQIVYELENRVFERGTVMPATKKVVDTPQEMAPVVKNEPMSFGSTTLNIPKEMIKPAFQNDALDNQKQNTNMGIGVPRYATEEIYKTPAPSSNPIVGSKLNSVTPSIKPIETKYQKDPYREPLE